MNQSKNKDIIVYADMTIYLKSLKKKKRTRQSKSSIRLMILKF